MAENILKIALIVDTVALIVLVLMQSGKVEGFSSAVTGGTKSLSLFSQTKARGSDAFLEKASLVCTVLFIFITSILKIM